MFLFAPLQVILAITSTSETVIPTNHTICLFFFLVAVSVVFFCLSTFAEQVSDILQFPSVYNFPIHLHTCFLIYNDDKILCSKSVLKQCLILAAYNSNFFLLIISWMTTQLVAFNNPCLLFEKEFLCQRGLCYKLQLPSFCAKMEAIMFIIL